ncbi:hypothetical protein [Caulobacter sp. 1776]|uniref:hypothetical protein n=1 Tax=Caulobacter sp. 1776 TaxID=3156420 RepID=UPI003395C093
MANPNSGDAREAASREYLQLLEAYYRQREQEDALREARFQVASRLKEIDGELRGRAAAQTEAAAAAKREAD